LFCAGKNWTAVNASWLTRGRGSAAGCSAGLGEVAVCCSTPGYRMSCGRRWPQDALSRPGWPAQRARSSQSPGAAYGTRAEGQARLVAIAGEPGAERPAAAPTALSSFGRRVARGSRLSSRTAAKSKSCPKDGRLASSDFEGKIKLWPKDGAGEPVVLTHGSTVLSLAVLEDGGWPAAATMAPSSSGLLRKRK
jgi:hypothetical protein